MSKLETNTIDTVSGTSTLQVGSTNTSTITLGVSGDTINVPSGVTINNNGTQTGFGGTNTPNFHAYLNGDQTLASDSATKINFNAESWDTASAFDSSSNYRFTVPSGQAGKYFVYSTLYFESYTLQIQNTKLIFYVNGSSTGRIAGRNSYNAVNLSQSVIHGSRVLNLSVGDYIEVYAEFGASSTRTIAGDGTTGDTSYFGGYKLIE